MLKAAKLIEQYWNTSVHNMPNKSMHFYQKIKNHTPIVPKRKYIIQLVSQFNHNIVFNIFQSIILNTYYRIKRVQYLPLWVLRTHLPSSRCSLLGRRHVVTEGLACAPSTTRSGQIEHRTDCAGFVRYREPGK